MLYYGMRHANSCTIEQHTAPVLAWCQRIAANTRMLPAVLVLCRLCRCNTIRFFAVVAHSRSTRHHRLRLLRRGASDLLQSVIQIFLLFVIFTSLVGRFEVQQISMEPTFHEGQRVMVSQIGSALPMQFGHTAYAATGSEYTTSVLRRGQVVVFFDDDKETRLIKRLIGLPGDTLEIRDNVVSINGIPLDERYLRDEQGNRVDTTCTQVCGPLTLGDEEYFFMGDNRPSSRDSRHFGPVHADQIVGRVILRYWPLTEFSIDL
jgi:signal peptidase I